MCDCNDVVYVYVVINTNAGIPIKNKIFSTHAKADTYRKIWCRSEEHTSELQSH